METIKGLNQNMIVKMDKLLSYKIGKLVKYPKEWAGWLIGNIKGNVINIDEILIPPQEVSSAQVELGGKESDMWLLKQGDKIDKIVGHIHSHNSMGAYFSIGDQENHQKLIQTRCSLLFIVVAQPKKEVDYFDKSMTFCFKTKSWGFEVYNELECELQLLQKPNDKEDEKIIKRIDEIKKEYLELKAIIDKKEEKLTQIIDKEVEEELKTKLKLYPETEIYSGGYGFNFSGDNFPRRQEKLYSPNKNDLWVYEIDDLMEGELTRIMDFITNNETFKYIKEGEVRTEKYNQGGLDRFSLYVDCKKKKVMETLKKEVHRIVYSSGSTKVGEVDYDDY